MLISSAFFISAPEQNNADTERPQPVEAQNRISQLIARKRAQLLRLARLRSQVDHETQTDSSRIGRKNPKELQSRKLMLGTDSSDSGREVTMNKEDSDTDNDIVIDTKKKKKKLSTVSKKENATSCPNGNCAPSSSKSCRKTSRKASSNNRKRRMKYMLAFSESSDDDEDDNEMKSWGPSLKKRKLWNKNKNSEVKSSDTDAGGVSEASAEDVQGNISSSESDTYLNSGNEKKQNKSVKKVKRLRKRREKQSESENGTVLDDSDSNSSSEPVWCKTKRTDKKSSVQPNTPRLTIKNNKVRKWIGKVKFTQIETSSDSSDNSQIDYVHKISLRNKDSKVPNTSHLEALTKLKVSHTKLFNCTNGVPPNQNDDINNSESDDRKSNNNGSGVITPNIKHCTDMKTPDSGIVMAPCSSAGSMESGSNYNSRPGSSSGNGHAVSRDCDANNDASDDPDWLIFKKIKSRLDRANRNYRNHIGDSESN